jgi:hypothetical protein
LKLDLHTHIYEATKVAHPENGELLERCFRYLNNIHGLEIENGGYNIDKEKVIEIALEELSARAKRGQS